MIRATCGPARNWSRTDIAKPLTDERYALNLFGNGLVYHTDPFPEATEVTGDVKLRL